VSLVCRCSAGLRLLARHVRAVRRISHPQVHRPYGSALEPECGAPASARWSWLLLPLITGASFVPTMSTHQGGRAGHRRRADPRRDMSCVTGRGNRQGLTLLPMSEHRRSTWSWVVPRVRLRGPSPAGTPGHPGTPGRPGTSPAPPFSPSAQDFPRKGTGTRWV